MWPYSVIRELQVRITAAEIATEKAVREKAGLDQELRFVREELNAERNRRISAETMASERRAEVERLVEQNREVREELVRVHAERVKSLDALNLKLMENKTPAETKPIDFSNVDPVMKARMQLVTGVRDMHRAVDRALLTKLHPAFAQKVGEQRHPMNEPAGDLEAVGASD